MISHQISSSNLVSIKLLIDYWQTPDIQEVQIVILKVISSELLLHVLLNYAQPASNVVGLVIHRIAGELAWQYIAMTRNNLCIIWISLHFLFVYVLNTPGHFFMGKEKGRALLNTTGYFFMGIENGRFS